MSIPTLPKISFIIPTLNAAFILERCLIAIRSQNYPSEKVEIVIADGGSTDETIEIAKKYNAKIISNPEILHEPGKARASRASSGDILFFTDADNILATTDWIRLMVKAYMDNPKIMGFLPQTEPPFDSNSFNQYLGYLFTDPFTWFIYQNAANPKDFGRIYNPIVKNKHYQTYMFTSEDHPLFGLSQGVGTARSFKRGALGWNDDILSGIKLISEGGVIAYVPGAGVYHYHVKGFFDFLKKYKWRIRNNLIHKIKGMGFSNREKYLNRERRLRKVLFIPYSFSLVLPLYDSIRLSLKYKNIVMMWHFLACIALSIEIVYEMIKIRIGIIPQLSKIYGK